MTPLCIRKSCFRESAPMAECKADRSPIVVSPAHAGKRLTRLVHGKLPPSQAGEMLEQSFTLETRYPESGQETGRAS